MGARFSKNDDVDGDAIDGSKAIKMSPWRNLAFDIYKVQIGEEVFEEKIAEADKLPPEPSKSGSMYMDLYTCKCQISFALIAPKIHPRSIGATGIAKIVSNPDLPEHDLFKPGHVFPIRLCHSNLVSTDDARADVRVANLKFSDSDVDSPLDLMMDTGEETFFWDALSFDKMFKVLHANPKSRRNFFMENPWHSHLLITSLRRAPESYTDQRYYTWVVHEFKAKDELPRYAKFRLVPADDREESGLFTEYEQQRSWDFSRFPDDDRPYDYLISEFQERLIRQPIKHKLQIQLHEIKPGDSHLVRHASRVWDQADHPWHDLAEITLTTLLPFEVVKATQCSINNVPASLEVLPPCSVHDYNSGSFVRSKVFPGFHNAIVTRPTEARHKKNYVIRVQTANRKGAGTDATVTLTMTGVKGRTNPLVLDKWFKNDFEANQIDTYDLKALDVGELMLIKLTNSGRGHRSDWLVDRVVIVSGKDEKNKEYYEFPCYHWIQDEKVVFEGKALLVTDRQHEARRAQRQIELQEKQELYHWGDEPTYSDFPGYIKAEEYDPKKLPKDVQFTQEDNEDLFKATAHGILNLGLVHLHNVFVPFDDFDDFRKAFAGFVGDVPQAADHWQADWYFAAQFLNGCNPDTIKRCLELPSNFPVTDKMVENLLDKGDSLQKAITDGRVYMVDYKFLEDIPAMGQNDEKMERRYFCAALGLFYVKSSGDLMPIAIQMHQTPSPTNPIWTPNDNELDWTLAKMWLRNADTQWHQMITHLLRCHLFMEPLAVAAWRQLPSLHPIWKLLGPHIRGILAINTLGRQVLIPEGGVADTNLSVGGGGHIDLMKKYYMNMSWTSYDLPRVLEERGIKDAKKLPGFYYRDDALQLWQAIDEYVRDILNVYYHSDDDVIQDTELQAWIRDLHENGYPRKEGHVDHGFPASVPSIDKLRPLLTATIFTCACHHAAVNFSQLDVYGFPPNAPALMRQPPPTKKGVTAMNDIMQSLATKHESALVILTVYDLAMIYEDEKFLGDYSCGSFIDPAAHLAITDFQRKLKNISNAIKERNETLVVPYTYLLPERTPNSIAI